MTTVQLTRLDMVGEREMAKPVAIQDATFEQEVKESDTPVLVDFWAEWCGPCKMIAPVLEQIAEEKGDTLKIAKLDVDSNTNTAQSLGVTGIPTLILFKGGEPVERIVGFLPKPQLLKRIEPHL
jgi:thioredoxin 1